MERVTVGKEITSIGVIIFAIVYVVLRAGIPVQFGLVAISLTVMGGAIYYRYKHNLMEVYAYRIEEQPTIHTDEAVDGVPFAGNGTVDPIEQKLVESPSTKTQCVYYHYTKERYVRSGKSSRWVIDQNKIDFVPFGIRDIRGVLKVDLTDMDEDFSGFPMEKRDSNDAKYSEVDTKKLLLRQTCVGANRGLWESSEYRETEVALLPGTKIFAYGMVSQKDKDMVMHEEENVPLIITTKNRDDYIDYFFKDTILYFSHLLLCLGYTIFIFGLSLILGWTSNIVNPIIIIGDAAIIGSVLFTMYNRVITLNQRTEDSLSDVDIELKRRAELIPNIVNIVKGYAKYERETDLILAEARAGIAFSKEQEEGKIISSPSLIASVESYPDLKAEEGFGKLMEELTDAEDRVAYAREFYNRNATKYNTLIGSFPCLLIAIVCHMTKKNYLTIQQGESAVPKVSI